jgi:hypothetical protein
MRWTSLSVSLCDLTPSRFARVHFIPKDFTIRLLTTVRPRRHNNRRGSGGGIERRQRLLMLLSDTDGDSPNSVVGPFLLWLRIRSLRGPDQQEYGLCRLFMHGIRSASTLTEREAG